jgi:hypothetical protein
MARALLTPTASSAGSTAASRHVMAAASTNGYYIKTTGYDATKLAIFVTRSTNSSDVARITLISGSTASKEDYEPGAYSTRRNLDINITTSTAASTGLHQIVIEETARFKDTDEYIKFDLSTALAGGTVQVGATYIA